MNTTPLCPGCGKPLGPDAPKGLCQECLLKAAFPTGTDSGGAARPFNPPSVAELAGKFPQLEVLELIGSGGMGAVYRARQKELDRIVALKILPPGIGQDAAFAERFTREARALAKLNHPGIVTLYEFGRANGLFYFLMEFVDGVSLRRVLEGGRISSREALAIVPQICDALQYAHDLGIVHRDIKPENILLDRRGRVKVADFGLVKLVGAVSELAGEGGTAVDSTALTEAGKVMGTPNYIAPEQMEHPSEVDHRADIYALGVVLYQMLTGELPGKPIEPPSSKVQIDVRLDEVVLRALAKQPERRYQQVSVLKTEIETIAADAAASGRNPAVEEHQAATESVPDVKAMAAARNQIKVPASGVFIAGCLDVALIVFALSSALLLDHNATAELVPPKLSTVVPSVAMLFIAGVIIAGASQMRRLSSHRLAMTASILAIILPPGALIGLPFGIWALIVLNQSQVRQAFEATRARRAASFGRGDESAPAPKSESRLSNAEMPGGGPPSQPPSSGVAESSSPRWLVAARWTARILGTLCILLVVPFIIAEGLPAIASQPGGVQLTFAGGFLLVLGFIVGWWRDGAAALLIAAGWTVIRISENSFATPFELVLAPAALYALCWWSTHGRRPTPPFISAAAFAVLLVLGRLFCPVNVFVSGMVSDAATGRPIADAELRLLPRPALAQGETSPPNMRSDANGRFRLYVGWYAEGKQVAISARGYDTLTGPLGPRPLGARRLNRDFQLRPENQFGAVVERVLYSASTQRPIKGEDLDAGREITAPADLENRGEHQFFHWLASEGVDLMAWSHTRFWTLWASPKLASVEPSVWDKPDPARLRTALRSGGTGLVRQEPDSMEGFISYTLPTNALFPLTFAFETRSGNQGLLQITGLADSPRGLKTRYKLLRSPQPGVNTSSGLKPRVTVAREGLAVSALSNELWQASVTFHNQRTWASPAFPVLFYAGSPKKDGRLISRKTAGPFGPGETVTESTSRHRPYLTSTKGL